ncbi:MAG: SDR family NAD(P)-dependent oxidoreductase [Bacteroidota bacterium]|nr:SDR family NAD(P)-dependent oxidoreductase [Bacteroidota bacterium]
MSKLTGKIAVITGGTGGLGQSVVTSFLNHGATVIATHTGNTASMIFIKNTGIQFQNFDAQQIDVTDEKNVSNFCQNVMHEYSRVDILCNLVGGVSSKNNIEDMAVEEWEKMLTLNLRSTFFMMKNILPHMKRNQFGRIINIAARVGLTPEPQRGGYGVSKASVIALTKIAAEEAKLTSADLTVNAIAPSIILTEENKKWGTPEDFKKWVTPKEIADAMIYLCSDEAKSINGQIIQMYGKV